MLLADRPNPAVISLDLRDPAEGWRKRRYEGAFVAKLNDAEAETAETQTWLEFAVKSGYLYAATARDLYQQRDRILGKLVNMINDPSPWLMPGTTSDRSHTSGTPQRTSRPPRS